MEFDLSKKATDERLKEFANKIQELSKKIGFKVSSRGWCFKPDALVNTSNNFEKIKEIKKGTKVLSFENKIKPKKTIDIYENNFYGDLISIKAYHLLPIISTPEHPIAVITRDICGKPERYNYSKINWLPAHKIKEGIYENRKKRHNLCYMINRKVIEDEKINVNLCILLGYYIAEGSIIFSDKGKKTPKAIEFTLNINEKDIALDIQRIAMAEFDAKTTITDRPSQNTKRVFVYSAKLSRLLIKLAGRISWEKKLHPSLMFLPPEKQLIIYYSARLGDGYSKGHCHQYYTTSKELALQFQQILFRNNKIGSLVGVPNGKFAKRNLYILTNYDSDRHIGEIRGDLFITPVCSINKEHYDGKVYNFAVEDTQNYGVQYILVHNCYQLETERIINKDEFDKVESWINKCRKKGILPINFTAEEEGRKFSCVEIPHEQSPIQEMREWIGYSMNSHLMYRPDWWDGEEYYIQMLVEKVDLKTLFMPICKKYHIPIATSKGWSSMLQRAEYARRFKEAEDKGLKCVLLYCGDHDPDGLRISEFIRKNLADLENVIWDDDVIGYNPKDLIIHRFGLDSDFIEKHKLTWINNLITGSGGELAKEVNGTFIAGRSKSGKPHKNFNMPYLQEYLKNYGVKKCEANAIVPMPEIAREFVEDAIIKFVGDNALNRFKEKRQKVIDELNEFKEKTGLQDALQKALDIIDEE